MNNNFLKHFAIIGSGTLISMFLSLLTTPIITRIVDPNEYGQLSIFNLYANIAMIVLCLGMDQSLVRFYYEKPEIEYKRALLFRCIKWPFIITILLCFAITCLSVSEIVEFEFEPIIMTLLSVFVLFQLIYRFSQLLIRLAYKSKLYSTLNILQKGMYVALALVLLYAINDHDLLMLVLSNVIAMICCVIISILAQRKEWNLFGNSDAACNISMRELIKYGTPFIITLGVTTLFQAIDQIALKIFCNYTEIGIYASTMSIVHIFAIVQTTFNTLWAPMAVEHYTKDPEDHSFYQKGNQVITVIMFFIGITLILCKDIFSLLLGEKYRAAAYILPFLIFNPIMYTISETTVSGLVFMKKSNVQVVVAVVACAVNAIGNLILVPILGCKGAAISTGLSYIIFFLLRTLLSNKYYYVDFKLNKFFILTFFVSIYALYNTFVSFNLFSVLGYLICLALLFVLYFKTIKWGVDYLIRFLKQSVFSQK